MRFFPSLSGLAIVRASAFLQIVAAACCVVSAGAGAGGEIVWSHALTNHSSGLFSPAIGSDGTLYVPDGQFLDALTASGTVKWRFTGPLPLQTPVVRHDGVVLVSTGEPFADSNFFALNDANGDVVWSSKSAPMAIAEGLHQTFLLEKTNVGAGPLFLRALNRDFSVAWTAQVRDDFLRPEARLAIGNEGQIYVTASGLSAYAKDGRKLWDKLVYEADYLWALNDWGDLFAVGAGPVNGLLANGPIKLDSNGRFQAVLPTTGSILPSGHLIGTRPSSTPSTNGCCELVSFDRDGHAKWVRPTQYELVGGIAVAADGSFYAIGAAESRGRWDLIKFGSDGSTLWATTLAAGEENTVTFAGTSSPTIGPDGTVYAGLIRTTSSGDSSEAKLFAVTGVPASRQHWPMPTHDPAERSSVEKVFTANIFQARSSQTSAVLRAAIKSVEPGADLLLTATLFLGETSDALKAVESTNVGSTLPRMLSFSLTNLEPMRKYYTSLRLTYRTTIFSTEVTSFETAGPTESIELTEEAFRFAALGGGKITFRTNGIITLSQPIVVNQDAMIDGRNVRLDGQNLSQLFSIRDANVKLQGFTFVNANRTGNPALGYCYRIRAAETAFGGAMAISNATVLIDSCTFSNSTVQGGGAGVSLPTCHGSPAPGYGGAIFAQSSRLTVTNSLFVNCTARGGAGAVFELPNAPSGGGVILAQDSELHILQSEFRGNSAAPGGSRLGVSEAQGGALLLSNSVCRILKSEFVSNSSGSGGAIFTDSALTLEDSHFDLNSANGTGSYRGGLDSFGGAVCSVSSNELSAARCSFTRNTAQGGSGGSPGGGDSPAGRTRGGAIYVSPGSLLMTNCVVGLNSVSPAGICCLPWWYAGAEGSGIYCSGATLEYSTIASNIFNHPLGSNGVAGIYSEGGSVSLHGVILSNQDTNGWGVFSDRGFNLTSDSSISLVQLSSRGATDSRLQAFKIVEGVGGIFLPQQNSPALDSGDPSNFPGSDLPGGPRPLGRGPEIGAIEVEPAIQLRLSLVSDGIRVEAISSGDEAPSLEQSADLVHWEDLPTGAPTNTISIFLPKEGSCRFYRVRPRGLSVGL